LYKNTYLNTLANDNIVFSHLWFLGTRPLSKPFNSAQLYISAIYQGDKSYIPY